MPIAGKTNGEQGPAKSGSKKITLTRSKLTPTPEKLAASAAAEEFDRRARLKPAKSMFTGIPIGSVGAVPRWLQQQ